MTNQETKPAMVGAQEPVAKLHDDGYWTPMKTEAGRALNDRLMRAGSPSIEVYTAAPVAQQPQARPDFTDEWTGYLKDGETPFERFLRERKDLQALTVLYQRSLEENERLKAQQPQAETDNHEAQGQLEFLDKKNNALSAAIRKVMARLADLLDEDQFKEIEEIVSFAGVQPQAEAVPLTHVLVPVDEPTDEMVDAACAAVDGLCRVDFVRAYVAAFAHLKAGYRDESYWCGWNAAIKFQQAEAVPVVDRVYEAAKRLVDHADFQLGGVLSAKSKARDIPSNAASKVKARHLASLRDALAKTPQQAEAVPSDVVRDADLALDLLSKLFDAYENGLACYEDPDEQAGYLGNAVELDADTIHACADLLNRRRPIAAIAQQKGQP